jgi:hypothetical protein
MKPRFTVAQQRFCSGVATRRTGWICLRQGSYAKAISAGCCLTGWTVRSLFQVLGDAGNGGTQAFRGGSGSGCHRPGRAGATPGRAGVRPADGCGQAVPLTRKALARRMGATANSSGRQHSR